MSKKFSVVCLFVLCFSAIVSLSITGSANGMQVFQSLDRIDPNFAAPLDDITTATAGPASTDQCPVAEKCNCQSSDDNPLADQVNRSAAVVGQLWSSQHSTAGELNALRDAAELSVETVVETSLADTTKNYCRQTAQLLAITLGSAHTGKTSNSDSIRQSIEAALLLVAETTSAQAEAKIAVLKAEHAAKLAALQFNYPLSSGQPTITTVQPATTSLQEYVAPVLAKLTRSEIRLSSIADQQALFQRNLNQLEERFNQANAIPPQVIANPLYRDSPSSSAFNTALMPLRESAESARSDIEQDLQQQIARLQRQLQEVQEQQARSARQWEPLHSADRPLLPLNKR